MLVNTLPRVLQLTVLPDPAYQAREDMEGTWSLLSRRLRVARAAFRFWRRAQSQTGLSQHSLVELGHSLRISTRFKNQALKKLHWNFPLRLLYWYYSTRLALSCYSRVMVTSLPGPALSSKSADRGDGARLRGS